MNKEDSFRNWLIVNKGLSSKSAKDVISRLKRASLYTDFSSKANVNQIIFYMDNNLEFKKITLTVKSQMRRAIRLLFEFKKTTRSLYIPPPPPNKISNKINLDGTIPETPYLIWLSLIFLH